VNITAVFIAFLAWFSPLAQDAARDDGPRLAAESGPLAPGLWGGDHVRMVVSRAGARLEHDCAESAIEQPILVDAKGRFTAKGSFRRERGGPRREDPVAGDRARFVGQVSGDTMRLTVTLESSKQPVGVFTLTRGNDPLLTKCR
jgi:hypothetical protein